jgi:hypothetical protein
MCYVATGTFRLRTAINALLTLKGEYYVICIVGTRIPNGVHKGKNNYFRRPNVKSPPKFPMRKSEEFFFFDKLNFSFCSECCKQKEVSLGLLLRVRK